MSESANWEQSAIEELVQLAGRDRRQATRIMTAMRRYLREDQGDVIKLSGRDEEWRLRVEIGA